MRPGSRRTGDPSQLRGVLWLPCCRLAGGDLRPCRKSIGGILQRRCQTCAAPAIAVICCIISETNSEKNAPGGRLSDRGNAAGGYAGNLRNPSPPQPLPFCRKLANNYPARPTGYLAFLWTAKIRTGPLSCARKMPLRKSTKVNMPPAAALRFFPRYFNRSAPARFQHFSTIKIPTFTNILSRRHMMVNDGIREGKNP